MERERKQDGSIETQTEAGRLFRRDPDGSGIKEGILGVGPFSGLEPPSMSNNDLSSVLRRLAPVPTGLQKHCLVGASPVELSSGEVPIWWSFGPFDRSRADAARGGAFDINLQIGTAVAAAVFVDQLRLDIVSSIFGNAAPSDLDKWVHGRVGWLGRGSQLRVLALDPDLVRWLELNWSSRAVPELGLLLQYCFETAAADGVLRLHPSLEPYLRLRLAALGDRQAQFQRGRVRIRVSPESHSRTRKAHPREGIPLSRG